MRKVLIIFILSFVSTVCFAKPKSEPDWFKNYKTVFPNSEYLAQRGSGVTAEDAKDRCSFSASPIFSIYGKCKSFYNNVIYYDRFIYSGRNLCNR